MWLSALTWFINLLRRREPVKEPVISVDGDDNVLAQDHSAAASSGGVANTGDVGGDFVAGNKVTVQLREAALTFDGRDLLGRLIEEAQDNKDRNGASRARCESHFADLAYFHDDYKRWPSEFKAALKSYRIRIQTGGLSSNSYFEKHFVPDAERLIAETKAVLDSNYGRPNLRWL